MALLEMVGEAPDDVDFDFSYSSFYFCVVGLNSPHFA